MPPTVTNAFRKWLKRNVNMNLISNAAITCVIYEGIMNFDSLSDFDKTSIEYLPRTCKVTILVIPEDIPVGITAEAKVLGANIGIISVRRLIIVMKAVQYCESIGRMLSPANMHYMNVLSKFNIEEEVYADLLKKTEPGVPLIKDKDNDKGGSNGDQSSFTAFPGI